MFRKLFIIIGIVFIGALAAAQNNQVSSPNLPSLRQGNSWFGLTSGYINSSYPFGFALHFGVKNVSGPDLRISGSLQFREGTASLGVGADVLTPFSQVSPLTIYGGGGGIIMFESQSFLIDAHGLVGAEYSFADFDLEEIGAFVEVRLGAALAVGGIPQPSVPSASAVVGFNIYF